MDKTQQLYDALFKSGDVTVPFDEFQSHYSKPENMTKLHGALSKRGDVTVPIEEFSGYYFPTATEGAKKNTATGGSPVSSVDGGTGSENTKTETVGGVPAQPTLAETSLPVEIRPLSGVLSPIEQGKREQEVRSQLPMELADVMKAESGDVDAALRNTQRERDKHPERYYGLSDKDKQEMWRKQDEEVKAAVSAKKTNPQPLTTKMLDIYDSKVKQEKGTTIGDALNLTDGVNRDERAMGGLKSQLVGTPLGAELETRLQDIWKKTNLDDKDSIENATLDAKKALFDLVGDKDTEVWDDYAKSEANYNEYNPVGFHNRLNSQIKTTYANANVTEKDAYQQLLMAPLERGVMDEARTQEAKLVEQLDQQGEYLDLALESGDQSRIEKTKGNYNRTRNQIDELRTTRLAAVDDEISKLQRMLVNPSFSDEQKVQFKAGLDKLNGIKQGFINPKAVVEAKYALYEPQAKAAMPTGTPMQQLRKLYSELEYQRGVLLSRIVKAEGQGGAARFAANEMINSIGGGGHNDDHKRFIEVDSQLKDLAPIVYLNESPEVKAHETTLWEDVKNIGGKVASFAGGVPLAVGLATGAFEGGEETKSGFGSTAWAGLLNTMGGKGSPLSSTSKQEDAMELMRNLQIGGVPAEALSDPTMAHLKERAKEPGLLDRSYAGNLLGTSGGLMFHLLLAAEGTRGLGLASALSSLTRAAKLGKGGTTVLAMLGDAIESGVNYKTAGTFSVDNNEELTFAGGFLGGLAGGLGKMGVNKASNVIAKVFGDKASEAVKTIAGWGARRVGAGVGESFEETGQQIVQLWNQSDTADAFWEKMGKQFGDLSEGVKFYVSTFVMGGIMGPANSDGLGAHLQQYADQQLAAMNPEDRRRAEEIRQQVLAEQQALLEASQNPETQAEGGETQAPAQQLTPEAQAAQDELQKRKELDDKLVAQGLGDRLDNTMTNEERIRAELQALKDKEQGVNQPVVDARDDNGNPMPVEQPRGLSEAEKTQMQHLETVVAGLDQIANNQHLVESPATEQVSTNTENSGNETPTAPPNTTPFEVGGQTINLPTIEGQQTPMAEVGTQPVTPATENRVQIEDKTLTEGRTTGNINIDGKPQGHYNIEIHGNTAHLADIQLGYDEAQGQELRGKGHGLEAYKQLAARLAKDGITLVSTNFGETQTTISPQAIGVWEKLVKQGLARVTGQIEGVVHDRFTGKTEVKPINTYEYVAPTVEGSQEVVSPASETVTPAVETAQNSGTEPTVSTQETVPTAIDQATAIDVGMDIANQLAQAGIYTRANWEAAMRSPQYNGALDQHIERAWKSMSKQIPEGSKTTPKAKPATTGTQSTQGSGKKKKVKSKKTGTQRLMEKYIDTAAKALKDIIEKTPMLKSAYDQNEVYARAVKSVKEHVKKGTIGQLMNELKQPSNSSDGDLQQFQRMALVKMFGAIAEELTETRNKAELAGDKAAQKKAQVSLDRAVTNLSEMLVAFNDNALGAGRMGAASGMWVAIGKSMDVYAISVIDKANRKIMAKAKAANGKALDTATKEAADNINAAAAENADAIANSTDGVAQQAAEDTKPKKKTTIFGLTREEAKAAKKKALDEFNSIRISGSANSMLAPNGFAKTAALAKVGFYALAEGAIAFNDWVANMKKTVPNVTDQELRDAWESNLNGRTLAEESEMLMRQRALDSIVRTLESTSTSENSETAKETNKIRDAMAKELNQIIEDGGTLEDFKKKYGLTDQQTEDLAESILKATPEALDKLAGSRAKAKKIQFAAESYLPKEKRTKTADQKAKDAKTKEIRLKVKETIRDHFKKPDGRPLIDKLVEAGLDLEQAQKVEDAVKQNAQQILNQAVSGELDHIVSGESHRAAREFKPPKKGKKKTQAEALIDQLVNGEISDRYIQGMVAHRYGLGIMPSPDQIVRLRKLGQAVADAPANSNYQKIALKELAKALDEIMPRTGANGKTYSRLRVILDDFSTTWGGLVMSSTLNSINTFGVNIYSITDSFLLGPAKAFIDPNQWGDLIKAFLNKDQNALLMNPLAKTIVKMSAMGRPLRSMYNAFVSAMQTGVTSARHDESIMDSDPAKMLPSLERKQRTAFGRFMVENPWATIRVKGKDYALNPYVGIFGKLVGAILAASDAAMVAGYGDLEYLDAMRMAVGRTQNKGGVARLKKMIGEYMAKNSQLWQDSMQKATDEATAMTNLTGKPVSEETIKVRAREIAKAEFSKKNGITEDELESVQLVAQLNSLTYKRQGGFGKLATIIGKIKNAHPALRIAMMPFFLFTEIPGNYGDAVLDATPGYGLLRALGISPTGLMQRMGITETSARLGKLGSRERRKQIETIAFTHFMMVAAYVLLKSQDDDDDDPLIKGKDLQADESYTLNIGGFKIPFKAFAGLAPAFIFAKTFINAENDPTYKTEGAASALLGKSLAATTALTGFYTDQTFMKGLQELGDVISTISRTAKGEVSTDNFVKGMIGPYIKLGLKPNPLTQGITRFIRDCFDPHKYTEENWREFLAMSLGMERELNERKRDISGKEIVQYPGYNILNVKAILDKITGDEYPDKEFWKFLAKTNTNIEMPSNSVMKFIDKDSEMGFTFREMTPSEWNEFNKVAGEKFVVSVLDYIDKNYPEAKGDVSVKGSKLKPTVHVELSKLWTDSRSDARDELFGKDKKFPAIATDKEAQKLFDEAFSQD